MNDTMKKYIHSKINDDFGLSVSDVAKHVGGYGRFSGWLGGNQSKIKEVLNAVKNAGVSPAFFASYECGEGSNSSWGWLNHTSPQGGPVEDAKAVCAWIKSQAQKTAVPAWIDYANYKDFVPASVKAEGNADAKNLPSSSIGRIVVSGTAAATWEVYYPNGLKASYNGVQNYGAPITEQYKRILAWGGKIDGKGGSSDDDDDGGHSGGSDSGGFDPMALIKKAFDSFLKSIQDAMTWDLHSVGAEKFFTNQMFALQKTYNNTYRLQMNTPMLNKLNDLKNSIDTGSNGSSNGGKGDDDDKDDNSGGGNGKSVPPNGKNGKIIGGNWTYDNLPKKYKDAIAVPLFKPEYLNKPGNIFPQTGNTGQCTELTWAYMNQLHGQKQPTDDGQITNGQRVWEVYKAKGAKTTHSPTVGYGFSSKPPYLQASLPGVGHTGVVVAVFDDGSFLTANYNVPPHWSPSRIVEYALINGVPKNAGSNIVFFSGVA